MGNAKKMKNPSARFWTNKELRVTVEQSKAAGYKVEQDDGFTTITNPDNGDVVLMSMDQRGSQLVRLDKSYFQLF